MCACTQQDTTATDTPSVAGQKPVAPDSISEIPFKPGFGAVEDTLTGSLPADTILVETQFYEVALTTDGGGPISMKLKEYEYKNGGQIEMIPEPDAATPDARFAGGTFSSSRLQYQSSLGAGSYDATRDTLSLRFTYTGPNGGGIVKTYYFYPEDYHYDLTLSLENPTALGLERSYTLWWNTPLGVTESRAQDDYGAMQAVTMQGGSRETLEDWQGDQVNQSLDGSTQWVGLRTKFFSTAIIPLNREGEAAVAQGTRQQVSTPQGRLEVRNLTAGVLMPFSASGSVSDSFTVYVGPMDYLRMRGYGVNLEAILDIGTMAYVGWILKPFAFAIMWLLPKLHAMVPNYGLVLILFALLVKIVTLPLTLKQFKSMQGMKEIAPKIEELRKRYAKDPQALQRETMKLYREHGVNPMSGCLVMLPQMPLMIAMFRVFQATILLRHEPFVWFVDDLSRGATGLTDPLIILVVLMVVTQLLSSIITTGGGGAGQQKALTYIFPIVLGFLLYSLPSGLILYWTAFSLFSVIDWFLFKRNKSKNPHVKTA